MSTSEDLLCLGLDELRRYYDKISNDYDRVRTKVLTLFGGALVLLSFLYAGGDLFIPEAVYGKIFYVVGLAALVVGVIILAWATRPGIWAIPGELKEASRLTSRYKDKEEYLEYLRLEYIEGITFCKAKLAAKVQMLDLGGTLVFFGGIMLLIIKYFGG